jgi:hypothetical protein
MTTFEFEARLRAELREAAERERRRNAVARFMAAARALAPTLGQSVLPVAIGTAMVVLIAVAAIALISRSEHRPVAAPKVVAHLTVGESLGSPVAAYGSVWVSDPSRGELLRIDPDSRAVTARLPALGDVSVAAGAGALWALQEGPPRTPVHPQPAGVQHRGPLLRIDPSTNRVTARIALRTPQGRPITGIRVLTDGDAVWVSTPDGALHIDPQTNEVTQAISSPTQFVGSDFALTPDGLWARTANRRLLRFDPNTGAKLGTVRLALRQTGDAPLLETLGNGLAASVPGGLARVDPHTGRILWQRLLDQRLSGWTELDGLIWARSSGGKRERLSALDPGTGRIMTSVELDDFGGSGVAAIDNQLWLTTVGGSAEIVRP